MNNKLKARIIEMFGQQVIFSREVGISETRVSKIITGRIKPREDERQAWAEALKAKPKELFWE